MHRTRRWLVAPAIALTLVAGACSSSGGGNAATEVSCPVDALDSTTGVTDVTLWYQLNGKAADTLEAMVADYNASQSKVRVKAELQGASYDELLRKYEQGIPTNDLPTIVVAEDTATQFLIDSGTVMPAQSCFDASDLSTDGFAPAAVSRYTVDGSLWPGTASISDVLTYYNKNHLRRAGLDPDKAPQTLADVRTMAEQIKAAGVTDKPVVLLMDSWFVETQLTGSGQPVVNNDNGYGSDQTTEAVFDTDQTSAIFDWIKGMVDDGLLTPVQATDGTQDHYLAMATQNASMTVETSTAATTIQDFLGGDSSVSAGGVTSDQVDTSGLDIGAAPVFGVDAAGRVQLGGNGFWMTSSSSDPQKAAAWDFLTWWNQPDQQIRWHTEGSYLPFLTSVVDSPAVQTFWDTTLAGSFLKIAYEEMIDGVDPNFPGPLIGPYDKFRVSMRDAMFGVATQGTDPSTAIATAKDETNAAIQQYNDSNF